MTPVCRRQIVLGSALARGRGARQLGAIHFGSDVSQFARGTSSLYAAQQLRPQSACVHSYETTVRVDGSEWELELVDLPGPQEAELEQANADAFAVM